MMKKNDPQFIKEPVAKFITSARSKKPNTLKEAGIMLKDFHEGDPIHDTQDDEYKVSRLNRRRKTQKRKNKNFKKVLNIMKNNLQDF